MGERQTGKESNQEGESILTQEFVEPILAVTKEFLMTHDHLGPAIFLRLESDEQLVVPLAQLEGLMTAEERQSYFSSLGLSLRQAGERIREAILVSEVWYVAPEDEALDSPPSMHPKRKEAIAIIGRDSQRSRITHVLQPFGRDSQKRPVFGALEADYNIRVEEGNRSTGLIDHLFD